METIKEIIYNFKNKNNILETILGLIAGPLVLILGELLCLIKPEWSTFALLIVALIVPVVYSAICNIIIKLKSTGDKSQIYDYVKSTSKLSYYISYFLLFEIAAITEGEFSIGILISGIIVSLILTNIISFIIGIVKGYIGFNETMNEIHAKEDKTIVRSENVGNGRTKHYNKDGHLVGYTEIDDNGEIKHYDERFNVTGKSVVRGDGTVKHYDKNLSYSGASTINSNGTVTHYSKKGEYVGTSFDRGNGTSIHESNNK